MGWQNSLMLFQEQPVKYHLIQYLPCQPITLWNIIQRTFTNTWFLITKKPSLPLFIKCTSKYTRNWNSNCKWQQNWWALLDEAGLGWGTIISQVSAGEPFSSGWFKVYNMRELLSYFSCFSHEGLIVVQRFVPAVL